MDTSAAKQLKVGDIVCWDQNPEDLGEVVQVLVNGVVICWQSDVNKDMPIHFADMARVERVLKAVA